MQSLSIGKNRLPGVAPPSPVERTVCLEWRLSIEKDEAALSRDGVIPGHMVAIT